MAQGWECFSARQNPPGEHRAKSSRPNRRQWGKRAKGRRATEDRAVLSSGVQAERPGHIQLTRSGTEIRWPQAKARHNYMSSSIQPGTDKTGKANGRQRHTVQTTLCEQQVTNS